MPASPSLGRTPPKIPKSGSGECLGKSKIKMGALKWGLRPLSAICAQSSTIVHFCGLFGPLSKGNCRHKMTSIVGKEEEECPAKGAKRRKGRVKTGQPVPGPKQPRGQNVHRESAKNCFGLFGPRVHATLFRGGGNCVKQGFAPCEILLGLSLGDGGQN